MSGFSKSTEKLVTRLANWLNFLKKPSLIKPAAVAFVAPNYPYPMLPMMTLSFRLATVLILLKVWSFKSRGKTIYLKRWHLLKDIHLKTLSSFKISTDFICSILHNRRWSQNHEEKKTYNFQYWQKAVKLTAQADSDCICLAVTSAFSDSRTYINETPRYKLGQNATRKVKKSYCVHEQRLSLV